MIEIEKNKVKKPIYKKWWVWLIAIIVIITLVVPESNEEKTNTEKIAASTEVKKESLEKEPKEKTKEIKQEKPKKLSLEEQSKKFIDDNLNGKTIVEFNNALINLDNEKLEEMIIVGHKNGKQMTDDFDLIGRETTATGKVMDFVDLSFNTYNDRGKKSGSVTFTRDDKFYIYMGDKDIENYSIIKYDDLIHKDRDINEFFLGVYPEEISNFAMIDLDEEATLTIGDTITVEGDIYNYVLRRDYDDRTKIEDFHLSIENAHVLK